MIKTIIVTAVYLIICAVVLITMKKRNFSANRIWSMGFLLISLSAAYFLKCNIESPYVNEFIPFNKVINLVEFGYASILNELLIYAVPFVLLGFFLMPAFASVNVLWAFLIGIVTSLVFAAARLIGGGSFVTDEFLFAGIGCATGFGLYCFATDFIKKKTFVQKYEIPIPDKKKGLGGTIFVIVVYFFIALVMVFDYGETYAPIQFFESDVALPEMSLETTLNENDGDAYVYAPSTQSASERAMAISLALNVSGGVTSDEGVYVAEDDYSLLTYTESGSWTYTLKTAPEGDEISAEEAENSVRTLFDERTLLTVSLCEATDVVRKTSSDGEFTGYDIYFSTSVGTLPIVGSNTLVVSVGKGGTVTMIRKYDGDLMMESAQKIISQKRAYDLLLGGDGAYTLFTSAKSATVKECKLAYMANSSQGYYLPIWLFVCEAVGDDGSVIEFDAYVEAMK